MTPGIGQRNPQPATRRRSDRSVESVGGAAPEQPRFARFAAAMAAARAANAPQLMLDRDLSEDDIPPAAGRVLPRPRGAQWRAPRRPVAPWFGIASCVVLFGVVLAIVPMPPIGAGIERLIAPWLEWREDPEVTAPQNDQAPPAMPAPAAGRDEPQPGSMAVLADAGSRMAAGPAPDAPLSTVAAPEEPAARSVPVPTLKPLTDH